MRVGDLCWAPYRNETRPGVVVVEGRARYRVYFPPKAPRKERVAWVAKRDVFPRDCDARSPMEDRQRALEAGGWSTESAAKVARQEPSDDPRPLKALPELREVF